jgi:hypothetical protein
MMYIYIVVYIGQYILCFVMMNRIYILCFVMVYRICILCLVMVNRIKWVDYCIERKGVGKVSTRVGRGAESTRVRQRALEEIF